MAIAENHSVNKDCSESHQVPKTVTFRAVKDGSLDKLVVCKLKFFAFCIPAHLNTSCLFLQASSRLSFGTSRHALSNLKL